MTLIQVFDIKYDTDDGSDDDLPQEIAITLNDDTLDNDEIEELISDEISNITGFCHFGFDYTIL